jgi:hypothetical protein
MFYIENLVSDYITIGVVKFALSPVHLGPWLKGSQFGINEQFPAEIVARRQKLYPKMREAKQQRREVVLVRDRLYIDGEQYFPPEDRLLESEDNIINTTPPDTPKLQVS